jgi:hypothetical protein
MKKLFVLLTVCFLFGLAGSSFAQISLSGDLQVRARDDIRDNGQYGNYSDDLYYMLRAGLNVNANLGDGFFGKMRLEHYNYAGYIYTSRSGLDGTAYAPAIPGSNDIIARPTVNFTQLYLGVNREKWGIEAGIFPINGIANPILDLHFMPYVMVDIPFTLYRLNTLVGVSGYVAAGPGKINYFISNDFNGNYVEDAEGNDLNHPKDAYTIGANYDFKVADFGIQPIAMIRVASDSMQAPVSYGINLSSPDFSGVKVGFDAALSNQNVDGTAKYDAQLFRIKASVDPGFGSIEGWFDIAKRTDKVATGETGATMDVDHDYTYLWLLYKIPVFSSDHGSFTMIPRVRRITEKVDNEKDFTRYKIELLFAMSFK